MSCFLDLKLMVRARASAREWRSFTFLQMNLHIQTRFRSVLVQLADLNYFSTDFSALVIAICTPN